MTLIAAACTGRARCGLGGGVRYQALHYVSFPLQTLSKSTKMIPVMLMGKLLNKKTYEWSEYGDAVAISAGVTLFSFSESGKSGKEETATAFLGVCMLGVCVARPGVGGAGGGGGSVPGVSGGVWGVRGDTRRATRTCSDGRGWS